jgi:uncharacterized protein YutE (UPF0331/DUF86 family)
LVDPEAVATRLDRLAQLLEELERIRAAGPDAYRDDMRSRLAADHALQLSIQTCIDIGAHLVAELGMSTPSDYRGIFDSLRPAGLDSTLADRLEDAVGMRNILVHGYLDVDDELVWAALGRLDDLRLFAAFSQAQIDR